MPEKIEVGKTFTYKVRGNLTIAGVTKEQVFEGSATLGTDDVLKGEAKATVNRDDYKLVIPNMPFVADVDEQVRLEIAFTASSI